VRSLLTFILSVAFVATFSQATLANGNDAKANGKLINGFKALPGAAFDLDWQNEKSSNNRLFVFPEVVGRYDQAGFGTTMFSSQSGDLWFETTSRSGWKDSDFVPGEHILCDPNIHVGFLPIQGSVILTNGRDVLALRSQTAAESARRDNEQATGACLRPKAGGGFESTLFSTYTIANGHGRFECAELVRPFTRVEVTNSEGATPQIDLFGIETTLRLDGDLMIRSTAVDEYSDVPLSGLIHVPQACH
jgi:hypothetical protein